jgi:hypothetical protein
MFAGVHIFADLDADTGLRLAHGAACRMASTPVRTISHFEFNFAAAKP